MSVTLYVKDAPSHKEKVVCHCVEEARAFDGSKADPECWACEGTGEVQEDVYEGAQPLNMSNGNAVAILRLLGFEGDDLYCGQIELAEIPKVRRKIMALRASSGARSSAIRMPSDTQASPNACRVFESGLDDSYVLARLEGIEALLMQAQSLGTSVYWN